jgi:hypothetical protein
MFSPQTIDVLARTLFSRLQASGGTASSPLLNSPAAISALLKSPATESPLQVPRTEPARANTLPNATTNPGDDADNFFRDEIGSLDGSALSRTCSGSSFVSTSVSQSDGFPNSRGHDDGGDDSDAEFFDSYDSITEARGSRVKYQVSDKAIVNKPIMQLLDGELLAPLRSNLFKWRTSKETGQIIKRATIVFSAFKKEIHDTIRDLVAKAEHNLEGPNLAHRYFWCAYDLARKRRANHIQEWRKYRHPKELIYGGKEKFIETYGNPWGKGNSMRRKKSVGRRKRSRKIQYPASDTQEIKKQRRASMTNGSAKPARHVITQPVVRVTQPVGKPVVRVTQPGVKPVVRVTQPGVKPARHVITQPGVTITQPVGKPVVRVTQPVGKPVVRVTQPGVKPVVRVTQPGVEPDAIITQPDFFADLDFEADPFFDDEFDPSDARSRSLSGDFVCSGCGEKFAIKDSYPRNNQEWANIDNNDLRCGPCYDRRTRDEYVPQLQTQIAIEEARKKSKQKDGKDPKKKTKTKKKRVCKKCGSTTHSMVTSKLCPMNKKYNRHETDKVEP